MDLVASAIVDDRANPRDGQRRLGYIRREDHLVNSIASIFCRNRSKALVKVNA
jgi:hypothetical protein